MSLAELKKKRNSVEQLQEKLQKLESKSSSSKQEDIRFWKPTRDENGNGSFLIRFLPAPVNENDSFVRVYSSSIQNFKSKKYLNELSLATIGQTDPVGEYFFKLKEAGDSRSEWIRRSEKFISNILVIKDPAHPENEGKVFLFEYGKQIFNKIKNKMSPDDGFDDEAFDPFDPWTGANLKIKIISKDMTLNGKNVSMPNYDNSEFAAQSKIGDDDAIEEVYNQEHSLAEFIDPKRFKSYDELKKSAERVLEINSTDAPKSEEPEENPEEEPAPAPKKKAAPVEESEEEDPKPVKKAKPAPKPATDESSSSEEDFFNNLLG